MTRFNSTTCKTRASNWKPAALTLCTALTLGLLASCSASNDTWPQPADEAALKKLEERSLSLANSSTAGFRLLGGKRREERSRLLFLLGQEQLGRWLESQKSGSSADRNEEAARAALGAFERVVDLGGDLVPSARHNIEFIAANMAKPPEQPGQQDGQDGQQEGKQDQQDPQSGQQDGQDSKDGQDGEQNPGEQKPQDGQDDTAGQNEPAGQESAAPERDLSGLVKDREDDGALEEALEAALAREREKQEARAGTMPPVAEDW